MLNLSNATIVDPILTSLAQGYMLPEADVASFIAPTVPVTLRSGKVLRFGKEAFAVGDYRRAYGANIPHVSTQFGSDSYTLNQEALSWEIPEEIIQEAENGPAQIEIRSIETRNVMARLQNSHEKVVADAVSNPAIYESGLAYSTFTNFRTANAGPGTAWGTTGATPIQDIIRLKRMVADQIGVRPNSMVLGTGIYDTLLTSPEVLDRIKYTSAESINGDLLAGYFGLERGVRVAEGRYLSNDGKLLPIFPENAVLVFYSAGSGSQESVMPASGMSMSTPSFMYTYQLASGGVTAKPEYYVPERRVIRCDHVIERSAQLIGLGSTGLVGSGALVLDITA